MGQRLRTGRGYVRAQGFRPEAMGRWLWARGFALRSIGQKQWSKGVGPGATRQGLRGRSYGAGATGQELRGRSYQPEATRQGLWAKGMTLKLLARIYWLGAETKGNQKGGQSILWILEDMGSPSS